MVRGITRFREHFRSHAGQYVLIGGAACDLIMGEAGLTFRATKDLDIVLSVDALDASFVRAFWQFVREGKYQAQQRATGEPRYYRFLRPQDEEYPFMLELFARKPDVLSLAPGAHLTPIPIDESISSLSAILLDQAYYVFLHSGKRTIEGIPIVGAEHLIPLKARAWLDLTRRAQAGEPMDAKSIAKHKNDVFRLYRVIDPTRRLVLPDEIRADMADFLDAMASQPPQLKNLGFKDYELDSILEELGRLYVHS